MFAQKPMNAAGVRLTLLVALAVVVGAGSDVTSAAEGPQAVVGVVAYVRDTAGDGAGRAGAMSRVAGRLGTGYVSATDGSIVTCYHTVVDADRVEVLVGNVSHEAQVYRLAPGHDLAALRTKTALNLPRLPTFNRDVAVAFGHDLQIIGHSLGLQHLITSARLAKPDWVPSEQLRVHGERLFASGSRLLMLEAGAIHDGMSGSPVMIDGAVLAVLCGSLSEGGDLAWGMDPRALAGPDSVQVTEGFKQWPTFTMVRSSAWRSLVRSAGQDDPRGLALVSYLRNWDDQRKMYLEHLDLLVQLKEAARRAISLLEQPGVPPWLANEQVDAALLALKRERHSNDAQLQAFTDTSHEAIAISERIYELARRMPRTQENLALADEFVATVLPLAAGGRNESVEATIADMEAREREEKRFLSLATELSANPDRRLLLLRELLALADSGWQRALRRGEDDLRTRNMTAASGKMLFLDVESRPWTFHGGDFELTFPAGWALVRARDMPRPELAAAVRKVEQEVYLRVGVKLLVLASTKALPQMILTFGEARQCGPQPGLKAVVLKGAAGAWYGQAAPTRDVHRQVLSACSRSGKAYVLECGYPANSADAGEAACSQVALTLRWP